MNKDTGHCEKCDKLKAELREALQEVQGWK
jgi:hypothetical protein